MKTILKHIAIYAIVFIFLLLTNKFILAEKNIFEDIVKIMIIVIIMTLILTLYNFIKKK